MEQSDIPYDDLPFGYDDDCDDDCEDCDDCDDEFDAECYNYEDQHYGDDDCDDMAAEYASMNRQMDRDRAAEIRSAR